MFTNITFRIFKLVSQPFIQNTRKPLLLKPGQWPCNTKETPHKTSVVTGKITKTTELYHTGCPLRVNKYAAFFGFTAMSY
jgi:hypothetical protein